MATLDKQLPVTLQELLLASLATSDALAKLLIEKKVITEAEFMERVAQERATHQTLLRH